MRVKVDDIQALSTLRPLDIAAYLRARGWSEVEADDPISVWETSAGGSTYEILAPLHQDWRDYGRRVQSVVETLGEAEGRSQLAILRDIVAVSADVVRLRAVSGTSTDDTIGFLDGLGMAAAGRELMLAAACSAARPQKSYAARKPTQATRFLEGLRLGQSERGSYVLTVISPVTPALHRSPTQTLLPEVSAAFAAEPYERRVTRTLGTALAQLHHAASRGAATGELTAFEEAVPMGVSADLCEALDFIRESSRISAFELSIGWAPSRPLPVAVANRTLFTPDVLEVIHEAGLLLRERSTIDDFDLEGPVIKLHQPPSHSQGTAVIFGLVNKKSRQVSVELSGDDWSLATRALREHHVFRCTGELTRTGKSYLLQNPRQVTIDSEA